MTNVIASHDNDSRDCLSRQIVTRDWLSRQIVTHVAACRGKLRLTWLLTVLNNDARDWLSRQITTHVTDFHDNDSRDCLSRHRDSRDWQITTHVTAFHDNVSRNYLSWQIMTHVTHNNDSRGCLSWKIATHVTLPWEIMPHVTACHGSDCVSRQIVTHVTHDSDSRDSRDELWLTWLVVTTVSHVTVTKSDIKTTALRRLILIEYGDTGRPLFAVDFRLPYQCVYRNYIQVFMPYAGFGQRLSH